MKHYIAFSITFILESFLYILLRFFMSDLSIIFSIILFFCLIFVYSSYYHRLKNHLKRLNEEKNKKQIVSECDPFGEENW